MATRLRSPSFLSLLAAAAAVTFAPSIARAQGADATSAPALFKQGQQLAAAGKLGEACAKFEASLALAQKTATLLNLADCYEREGKYATASARFSDAAALAHQQKRADREALAKRRVAALEPRVAKLTVVPPAGASGMAAKLDGTALTAGALGASFPIDAGHHVIEASAPGKQTWSTAVDVADAAAVTVTIPALADVVVEPPPPPACPSGTSWDGAKCAPKVDTSCDTGMHFVEGKGCAPDQVAMNVTPPPHETEQERADDKGRDSADAAREKAMHDAGRDRVRVPIMASFAYAQLGEEDFATPSGSTSCSASEMDLRGWKASGFGFSAGIRFAVSRALDLYFGGSYTRAQGSADHITCGPDSNGNTVGSNPQMTMNIASFVPELRILPGQQIFYIAVRPSISYAWGDANFQDGNGSQDLNKTNQGSSLAGLLYGGGLGFGFIFGPSHSIEAAARFSFLGGSWLNSGGIPVSELALGWAF